MTEIDYRWRTLGGEPPTEETAPYGVGIRWPDGRLAPGMTAALATSHRKADPDTQWWPLPAPPTESVPPPERWMVDGPYDGESYIRFNWRPDWEAFEATLADLSLYARTRAMNAARRHLTPPEVP